MDRERRLKEDFIILKRVYSQILFNDLPPHLLIRSVEDERILETVVKELRFLLDDFRKTADMCERAVCTYRGDND